MKGRESGMPAEDAWDAFFDADTAVERIFDAARMNGGDAVEFGCGYGTFTIPAAARMSGTLAALDIDPEMVRMVEDKAHCLSLANIRAELRDFVSAGTGLPFRCPLPLPRAKLWGSSGPTPPSTAARSTAFRSSRTLPGQA